MAEMSTHALSKIIVIHTTSKKDRAHTDSHFKIHAKANSDNRDFSADFPELDHNEREANRTDQYEFDVSKRGITTDTKIWMEMDEGYDDGWLPSSIYVLGIVDLQGQDPPDGHPIRVLGAHPQWNKWFDRGASPKAGSNYEYVISGYGAGTAGKDPSQTK